MQPPPPLGAPGGVPLVRLAAGHRHRRGGALHPLDLRRPGLPRRQPRPGGRGHGHDADRRAAGSHPPQHGLAAAGHRHHVHGLCAGRAGVPGLLKHAGASWSQLVNHQYLTSQGIYGVAVGVVATYVFHFVLFGVMATRIGLGQLFLDVASSDRRALCRRSGQGQRVRLGHVRHAVGQLGGQCGHRGLADHPRDDPRGLQARVCRRGGSGLVPPAGRSRRRCWAPRPS
jgi:hypothetical protein